jgi:uncharacterized membrane protein
MRLRVLLVVLAVGLTLAPLAPPLLAATHPFAALLLRNFFSQLCHQDPERSFLLGGAPVAVCARCLGIYWGAAIGALLRLRRARWWLGIAVVVNLADVAMEVLRWHGNAPGYRFVLGWMLGVGVGAVLLLPENLSPPRFSPLEDVSA